MALFGLVSPERKANAQVLIRLLLQFSTKNASENYSNNKSFQLDAYSPPPQKNPPTVRASVASHQDSATGGPQVKKFEQVSDFCH